MYVVYSVGAGFEYHTTPSIQTESFRGLFLSPQSEQQECGLNYAMANSVYIISNSLLTNRKFYLQLAVSLNKSHANGLQYVLWDTLFLFK